MIVFDHAALEGSNDWSGLGLKVHRVLDSLVAEHGGELVAAEVHAQGGFGAYVAVALLERFPGLVKRVFFICDDFGGEMVSSKFFESLVLFASSLFCG